MCLGCIGSIIVYDSKDLTNTSNATIGFECLCVSIVECAYVEDGRIF